MIDKKLQVALDEKYWEGYKNGLKTAENLVKSYADEKNPRWVFGSTEIPMTIDVATLMRTISYNLYLHIENIINKIERDYLSNGKKL